MLSRCDDVAADHGPYEVVGGEAFERAGESTWRPSRMTVTRWQIAKTSSSRCEMNSTAAPAARRRLDDPEEPRRPHRPKGPPSARP